MNELVKYEAAKLAIAEAKNTDEVKTIHNISAAMRAYARQANDKQMETDAVEIRIRAERRLGEMLKEQKEGEGLNPGTLLRGTSEEPRDPRPTLSDAGISKRLSSRAQAIASIPEDEFEATLADHREEQKIVTAKTMETLGRKGKEAQKRVDHPVSDARIYVRMAISQLERIRDDDPAAVVELDRAIQWIEERKRQL